MKANPEPPPCWGGLLICIFPCLIIFSILVQCFLTAWRINHKQPPRARRRPQQHRSSSRPRETREEARQRKYRYLYQVRTARGDIISQVSNHLKWLELAEHLQLLLLMVKTDYKWPAVTENSQKWLKLACNC